MVVRVIGVMVGHSRGGGRPGVFVQIKLMIIT